MKNYCERNENSSVIVFAQTCRECQALAYMFEGLGFKVRKKYCTFVLYSCEDMLCIGRSGGSVWISEEVRKFFEKEAAA